MVLRRDHDGELHIETNHRRHVDESEESVSATVRWTNFDRPASKTRDRAGTLEGGAWDGLASVRA
jgi:hypothetical protein